MLQTDQLFPITGSPFLSNAKRNDKSGFRMRYASKRPGSSGNNSLCNVSSDVVDRYVDGEQHQERNQTLRSLKEERMNLAMEVSEVLRCRIAERKLEKYRLEDHRLRELVKELAEHNVSLQRELCSISRRETESKSSMARSERELKEISAIMVELIEKNEELESRAEQNERKLESQEMVNKHVTKLRTEQIRVPGIEIALRKEVESYKLQINALRNENNSLLSCLRGHDSGDLTTELDKEMRNCVCCLQTRGVSMLNESTNLCSKLLEFIKTSNHYDARVAKTGLDGQFVLDCDVKVQGFKCGCETLTRNLQKMSLVLQKKARSSSSSSSSSSVDDPTSGDTLRSELKAERLITTVLREKLQSKDLEIEQLQAEVATAVRGNDILRNEIQNTSDDLSCALHKLKDLELQMSKKEDNAKGLQSDLQDSRKQLVVLRYILPTITQERDLMWDEVKQYSEQKMVLNSEVDTLKRKVDALNRDMRLREGQIALLKDSLDRRPFSLLDSLDFT